MAAGNAGHKGARALKLPLSQYAVRKYDVRECSRQAEDFPKRLEKAESANTLF